MKLTNRQIIDAVPSLDELLSLKLPVKTSFKIAKVVKLLNSSLDDYNKVFEQLRESHSEKDDEGKVKVEDNKVSIINPDEFETELNELLDIENELTIKQIKLNDFGKAEVSPSVLYKVDWLIQE